MSRSGRVRLWFSRNKAKWLAVVALAAIPFLLWVGDLLKSQWQLRNARQALQRGEVDAALQVLKPVERSPASPEALYLLARASRRAGLLQEAQHYLERASAAGWDREQIRQQQALLFVQTGRFDQGEKYVAEMLRKGCDDELAEEIYEAQSKGFLATYRLGEALVCLNYWIAWRPTARHARMRRADLWERCDNWQEAADDYRAVVQSHPGDLDARIRLGEALLHLNKVESAASEFDHCLRENSNDVRAAIGRGKCRRRLGEIAEAERQFRSLLQARVSSPQRADVLVELGELALRRQEARQAVQFLSEAVELDSLSRNAFHPLGLAYRRLGEEDKAREAEDRGRELISAHTRLSEITVQVIRTPEDPELRWKAGSILMDVGMKKEGAAWLQTAILCSPEHRKSHAALADYYAGLHDETRAAHHRRQAE